MNFLGPQSSQGNQRPTFLKCFNLWLWLTKTKEFSGKPLILTAFHLGCRSMRRSTAFIPLFLLTSLSSWATPTTPVQAAIKGDDVNGHRVSVNGPGHYTV